MNRNEIKKWPSDKVIPFRFEKEENIVKRIIRITIRIFIPIEPTTKEDENRKKEEHESTAA